MSFDTETYCGTKGYASPQGWQDGRNYFKDWPYYKEKLSQVQSDIYAIGSTFYECLKNEFMVDYKKYAKQDILNSFNTSPHSKYYSFYEYIFDKSYREVEGKLEELKNSETNEDYRLAYDCIYNMCRNSQQDRYKTISEVLQHPLFASRTMTRIIPGKIKATSMPSTNVCKSLIGNLTLEKAMKDNERSFVFMTSNQTYSLLTYITLYTLLYRTIYLAPSKFKLIFVSCLYLSIAVFKYIDLTYEYLSAIIREHKPEDIRNMVYKIVDELNGVIRVPSIYEETDNVLEIVWWLINVGKDCNYLSKSPKELHSTYAEIEAKKPKLISSRINKNQFLSVTYTYDNEYKVEYEFEGETKVIKLTDNNFI
jgi:hypothetical protein